MECDNIGGTRSCIDSLTISHCPSTPSYKGCHLRHIDEGRQLVRNIKGTLFGRRVRGRLRTRWKDAVRENMRKLNIYFKKNKVQIIVKAKDHFGL